MTKSEPIETFTAETNCCFVSPANMRCTLKISVNALYTYSLIEGFLISIKDQIENFDLGKKMINFKMKNLKLMLDIKKCGFTIPHKLIIALIEVLEEVFGVTDDVFKKFLTNWNIDYKGIRPVQRGYGLGFANYLATMILYILASDYSTCFHIFNDDQVIGLPNFMNYVNDSKNVLDGIIKFYESFDVIINRKKTFISSYMHYLEEVYDDKGNKYKNYSKKNRGKLNIVQSMFECNRLATHFAMVSIISQGDFQDLIPEIVHVYKEIGYTFHPYEILSSVYDGGLFPEDARVLTQGMHNLPSYFIYIEKYEQLVKSFFNKYEVSKTKYDVFNVSEAQYMDIDTSNIDIFEDFNLRSDVKPRHWRRLYKKLLKKVRYRQRFGFNALEIWKRRSERLLATVIPSNWIICRDFDNFSSYEHDISIGQTNQLKALYMIVSGQDLSDEEKAAFLPPYYRIHGIKYPEDLIRSVPFEVPISDLRATEIYYRKKVDFIQPWLYRYFTPYWKERFEFVYNRIYYNLYRNMKLNKPIKQISQKKLVKKSNFLITTEEIPLVNMAEELAESSNSFTLEQLRQEGSIEDQLNLKVDDETRLEYPEQLFVNDFDNMQVLEEDEEIDFLNDMNDDDPYGYVIDPDDKPAENAGGNLPNLDWD